jgi:transposase InsO family protein
MITDRTFKWMEAIPLSETFAATCARALVFSWITLFGVPEMITSDLGPQFTSNVWSQFCETLHITHRQSTAYHPELNGAVERLHCRLKDALRARTAVATWVQEIPWVLLGLRAQLKEDTGLSPAETVFVLQLFAK